jgi:transposase InsO family protein
VGLEVIRSECGLTKKRFASIIGTPYSTYKRWTRKHRLPRKSWPRPKRAIAARAVMDLDDDKLHWGHRKVWAYYWHPTNAVSMSTVERAMRDLGCLQPKRYLGELKQLAAKRRAAFDEIPERRNRVWQTDTTEFETANGGIWRIHNVVDYAAKYCLVSTARPTATAVDAIDVLHMAIAEARQLLGIPLICDLYDDDDDRWSMLRYVSDNGPCYKSGRFAKAVDNLLEVEHIRTRRKSPHTNGVVERYGGSLKAERLWRHDIRDGIELQQHLNAYRHQYNHDRPHEYLEWERPAEVYAAKTLKLKQANRGSQP